MENLMEHFEEPKSLVDLKTIISKWDPSKFDKDKINQKCFFCFLHGFRIIVRVFDEKKPEIYDKSTEKIILDWMQLYLNVQLLVSTSEVHLHWFSKHVPIAVTYIIGCIVKASNVTSHFYAQMLQMTIQLLLLSHKKPLQKLNTCSKGFISHLWTVIDKVGNFNSQMMVIDLIQQIMRNLDASSALSEVERLINNTALIKENILIMLTFNKNDARYKKLARAILNQHNMKLGSNSLVHSFACRRFKIGDQLSVSNDKRNDRFWIDFNSSPNTLTFQALLSSKSDACTESVDVSLKIKTFSCNEENLIIEFEPPADRRSVEINGINWKTTNKAFAVLSEKEMRRFVEIFKDNVNFRQDSNENKSDDNSLPKLSTSESAPPDLDSKFKKPSLKLFKSAFGMAKSLSTNSQDISKTFLANGKELKTNEEPILEPPKESEKPLKYLKTPRESFTSSQEFIICPTTHNCDDQRQPSRSQKLNSLIAHDKDSSIIKETILKQTEMNLTKQQIFENLKNSNRSLGTHDADLKKQNETVLKEGEESATKRFFKNPRQSCTFKGINYSPAVLDKDYNNQSFRSDGLSDSVPTQSQDLNLETNSSLPQTEESANKRRFFKNPRPPRKIEIPWITQPLKKRVVGNQRKRQVQKVEPVSKLAVNDNKQKLESNKENLVLETTSQPKKARFNPSEGMENYYDGPSTSRSAAIHNQMWRNENYTERPTTPVILNRDRKLRLSATFNTAAKDCSTLFKENAISIKSEFGNRKRSYICKDADSDSSDDSDFEQPKRKKIKKKQTTSVS